MKRILYISPENTVGSLNLWKNYHEEQGNFCRTITFYPSAAGYPEDICLNLPLISANSLWYRKIRHKLQQRWYKRDPQSARKGNPPLWESSGLAETMWFRVRDFVWSFYVEKAIRDYQLYDFDIYHFEWGLDFYRDLRFAKKVKAAGKKIINTYHGQDMRNRGVLPEMDAIADLRLSSELDLLELHPKLQYLFLPFDCSRIQPQYKKIRQPMKVCHATTNRYFKGSEHIIRVCRRLEQEGHVKFVLIEKQPHARAMEMKAGCDLNIDQLTDLGGWGYGMNSVESLAMGICTIAYLNPKYEAFIPDHPFVNTRPETLQERILELSQNPQRIAEKGKAGRDWVVKYHDIEACGKKLYKYYQSINAL
jgi:glycosyltransferase involved in cell wall biosynthesis